MFHIQLKQLTNKKKHKYYFQIALLILIFFAPYFVNAATVYIETNSIEFGAEDKKILNIRLNTEGNTINALEGLVGIYSPDGPVYVRELSVGGSDFSLWPNKPSLSTDKGNISINFVGGVPSGINKKDALLFTIALTAENTGTVYIAPVSLVGFANDGLGTPLSVKGSDLTLTVTPGQIVPKDEWKNLVSADTQPPLPFTVNIGRDPAVLDGKWFITFNATDNESGIDHYEVIEGERKSVRSGTTYVLQNQNLSEKVIVTAFDKAGNKRSALWQTSSLNAAFFDRMMIVITLFLLVVLVVGVIYRIRKGKIKLS
ncbi:MAG TPA: hypothetical protein PK720_03860 [bacterium]|nr:hypothetical protein [bacterium]